MCSVLAKSRALIVEENRYYTKLGTDLASFEDNPRNNFGLVGHKISNILKLDINC